MARPEDPLAAQDPHRGLVVAPGHARARLHARVHDGGEVHGVEGPHGQGEQENGGQAEEARPPRRRARDAQRGGGPGPPSRERAHGRSSSLLPGCVLLESARRRQESAPAVFGARAIIANAPHAPHGTLRVVPLQPLGDPRLPGLVAVGFLVVNLIVWKIIRPSRFSEEKLTTYECGENPTGSAWIQFNIRFYVFALIFIIFDVEAVFLLPWAVVFRRQRRAGPARLRGGPGLHRHPGRWRSPTSGARATSSGCAPEDRSVSMTEITGRHPEPVRRQRGLHHRRQRRELGPQVQPVADDLRPRLLRHRDDGHRRHAATTGTASA